ncbi:hypothetical protein NEAUS03_0123 [Nematocida ausubeli]|nr:hypothetical protein NEAUS03_0123 [Nematocida ausubeli]
MLMVGNFTTITNKMSLSNEVNLEGLVSGQASSLQMKLTLYARRQEC